MATAEKKCQIMGGQKCGDNARGGRKGGATRHLPSTLDVSLTVSAGVSSGEACADRAAECAGGGAACGEPELRKSPAGETEFGPGF